MNLHSLALAIPLLPLAAAAIVGLVRPIGRRGGLAATISIAAAAASLGCALLLLSHTAERFVLKLPWLPVGGRTLAEVGLRFDGISAPMLVVVGTVALMVQIYSVGYLSDEASGPRGRYFTWQSLFLFAMQGFVLSPNLLQLFSFYELIGLCSYLLIGYYWEKPSAGRAAVKAFWITKLGDVGFLIGLLVCWTQYKSFDLAAIEHAMTAGPAQANTWLLPALLFCGVASKSAQFPLHVWLPDAMEGPTPVSALLHAATMVAAGVYLLVSTSFLFAASPVMGEVVMYVGAFTAVFAALQGCVQNDIKRVLAYSTCSQLGLMVAAIGAGSVAAGYFHLVTHAFFKSLLFLAAGSAIHAVHTNDLREMGGLGRGMRWTGVFFGVGMLALAGIPPLSGFFSKELILASLEEHPVALVLGLATTIMTPYYMGRAFLLAFSGKPRSAAAEHPHESGWLMRGPMLLLCSLALIMGVFLWSFADTIHEPVHLEVTSIGLLGIALALAGLGLAWVFHGPRKTVIDALPKSLLEAARSSGVDALYVFGWRHVVFVFAATVSFFDRYIVDGLMNLIGWAGDRAGDALRRVQTGRAQDYVLALFLGLLALVAWGVWGG
ncbi:MAG: NADH-quinone oxidoreductase subunit L [Planctomycetes bacterium]|nr:NADH-quinone oxidoreductase subunit L [Planctomycetota bacterium]